MQQAFGTVLWIVCSVGILLALAALITSGATWKEYGKHRLIMDTDISRGPAAGSAAAIFERDSEIRELLEARNARRLRRGEAPLDIEAEFRRLTGVQVDPALRSEIRDLVIARNHRRVRAGKTPLDVDTEVERQIASLGDLSAPPTSR